MGHGRGAVESGKGLGDLPDGGGDGQGEDHLADFLGDRGSISKFWNEHLKVSNVETGSERLALLAPSLPPSLKMNKQ